VNWTIFWISMGVLAAVVYSVVLFFIKCRHPMSKREHNESEMSTVQRCNACAAVRIKQPGEKWGEWR
jgi:hypothetical protein